MSSANSEESDQNLASGAKQMRAYGHWPSQITAELVAGKALRLGHVQSFDHNIYWSETRPSEGGRTTLMRIDLSAADILDTEQEVLPVEILPKDYSARSQVHEYGGGEFIVAASADNADEANRNALVFFINAADQDIYQLDHTGQVTRLTNAPSHRFADMELDARNEVLIAVSEIHGSPHVENQLVTIDLKAAREAPLSPADITALVSGADFYAAPRLGPDGAQLAYLSWSLPDMPWEGAGLYVARYELNKNAPLQTQQIKADPTQFGAIYQPQWARTHADTEAVLYFVSDHSGWGNLYCWHSQSGDVRALAPMDAEWNKPQWSFATSSYVLADNGDIFAAPIKNGVMQLYHLTKDTAGSNSAYTITQIKTNVLSLDRLTALPARHDQQQFAAIGAGDLFAPAVLLHGQQRTKILRPSFDGDINPADIAIAQQHKFNNGEGEAVYGSYYPPTNHAYCGPDGDFAPTLLMAHGGPTGMSDTGLKLKTQYWTNRGFAVFDIDYAGSTGYGRAYRQRLDGLWGEKDVTDIISAMDYLCQSGLAKEKTFFITGGSAGGMTVLLALARSDQFLAAGCYYGVTDLAHLLKFTHKFEAGYLYNLLGFEKDDPRAAQILSARSPQTHIEKIKTPIAFFQGLDDKVVPPEQSQRMVAALRRHKVKVDYLEFEGEGHGFRREETLIACLNSEYNFFIDALNSSSHS